MSAMLDAAVAHARLGKPVFPVGIDKRPLCEHGLLDATTDLHRIERWWTAHPDDNVAVRTGEPAKFVVLDVDGQAGADSLHELEREHGPLPRTASVVTPRRGQHYYYRWPGVPIKTTAGVIAPGIDVRGDGGYVLVPPSRTRSGSYEYDELGLRPMPAWLLELTRDRAAHAGAATAAGVWEAIGQHPIPEGQRNVTLARIVGLLLRRRVPPVLAAALVQDMNRQRCKPPLPPREVQRIIDSVATRELRRRERRTRQCR